MCASPWSDPKRPLLIKPAGLYFHGAKITENHPQLDNFLNCRVVYRIGYFVIDMEELCGSVILLLAFLVGSFLGWFLRGQRETIKELVRHVEEVLTGSRIMILWAWFERGDVTLYLGNLLAFGVNTQFDIGLRNYI